MKKKLISWIMLLTLCISMVIPVTAATPETDFIIDEWGVFEDTDTYIESVQDIPDETEKENSKDEPEDNTEEDDLPEVNTWLVYDMGELLSDAEEEALNKKLQDVSKEYKTEIAIRTVTGFKDDIETYAKDCFEVNEIGYGDGTEGTLLVVSVEPNNYYIYSKGVTSEALDAEKIGEKMKSDLSAGNYKAAFDTFAAQCEYYLDGHINGFPFAFAKNLVICLIIGFIIGLIVALVFKGQLKSVRKQDAAANYVKPGSMQLTHSGDYFMYRTITRKEKQQNNSSSDSGSSRGSGGGTF